MRTLVVVRPREIGGRQFQHGEELPPDFLPREAVDKLLDAGWLTEHDSDDRRSLYRLFASFSGCKETEPFTKQELTDFTLSP